jgi:predicted nucleotidyltransferase
MQEKVPEIPAEALAALAAAMEILEGRLLAVYLHGSAVSGGLRPQSDVDILVVVGRHMTDAMRDGLLASLLKISGRHPAGPGTPRCIELMVFLKSDLVAPGFQARCEFIYGEWLRDAFEAGEIPSPVADPEITLLLAQARREAKALHGPAPTSLLPEISADQVRHAMREWLPKLLDGLQGDERNVLLTLARMWRTAATAEFVTKDIAAEWAMPRLPERIADVLADARDAYLGRAGDDWNGRQAEVWGAANHLRQQVMALL